MDNSTHENAVRELRRDAVPAHQRVESGARPTPEAARPVAVEMDADGGPAQGRARRVPARARATARDRGSFARAPARSDGTRRPGGAARGARRSANEGRTPVSEGTVTARDDSQRSRRVAPAADGGPAGRGSGHGDQRADTDSPQGRSPRVRPKRL